MEKEAVGFTLPIKAEVTAGDTLLKCKKSEPQLSSGDSPQPPNTATSNEKAHLGYINEESGLCLNGKEKLATFQIGEQCLSSVMAQRSNTSDRSPVRLKSATFPKDATDRRSPADGRIQPSVRPKSPDCVLLGAPRVLSPKTTSNPIDIITPRLLDPWGGTYDRKWSSEIPDIIITSPGGSSEYTHTAKTNRPASRDDVDHTCSAVCADDPTCVKYHTAIMADTVASETPISHENRRFTSTINYTAPNSSAVFESSLQDIVTNAISSRQLKERPNSSVSAALLIAFENSVSPILYSSFQKGEDLCRHVDNNVCIPIHIPTQRPTMSALTTALPVTTAAILGKSACKYLENQSVEIHPTTDQPPDLKESSCEKNDNGSLCPTSQTHSGSPAIHVPSTTPILAESVENNFQVEMPISALLSVEHSQSSLRSLLLTTMVPALAKGFDTLSKNLKTERNECKSKLTSDLSSGAGPETTAVRPVMVGETSLLSRSSSLATSIVGVCGDDMGNGCMELTEIDLSDDIQDRPVDTKIKKSKSRSFLDVLLCRRRE